MVQADAGDDRGLRHVDDVGGVQAAAKAHLQHHDIALCRLEEAEGDGRHQLKLGGGVRHGVRRLLHPLGGVRQVLVADLFPVYLETLVVAQKVGRGVEPRPVARLLQDGGQHGGGGALAVGPGDVDELQGLLRVPQLGQQLPYPVQAQTAAVDRRLLIVAQCFLVGHGNVPSLFLPIFSVSFWRSIPGRGAAAPRPRRCPP